MLLRDRFVKKKLNYGKILDVQHERPLQNQSDSGLLAMALDDASIDRIEGALAMLARSLVPAVGGPRSKAGQLLQELALHPESGGISPPMVWKLTALFSGTEAPVEKKIGENG